MNYRKITFALLCLLVFLPIAAFAVETSPTELQQLTLPIDWRVELIYFIRVVIAFILGCVIGFLHDREKVDVGLKTYGAVALGAAMFSVISLHTYLAYNVGYALYIAGGLVIGVGFLGAGVIFKSGNTVRGIPTAATIWATAAIGLACGIGMYVIAIAGAIFISLFHLFSKYIASD